MTRKDRPGHLRTIRSGSAEESRRHRKVQLPEGWYSRLLSLIHKNKKWIDIDAFCEDEDHEARGLKISAKTLQRAAQPSINHLSVSKFEVLRQKLDQASPDDLLRLLSPPQQGLEDETSDGSVELNDKRALPLYCYVFSFDGKEALTGCRDNAVRLWSLETGRCLRLFEGHKAPVEDVAWNTDRLCALSGSDDETMRLWDIKTGLCLRVFAGHTDDVWSVSWSPDERSACSGSGDRSVRLWDVATGDCVGILEGHSGAVASLQWSRDQRRLLSGSDDCSVRVWDLSTRQCVQELKADSCVYVARWNPDETRVIAGTD